MLASKSNIARFFRLVKETLAIAVIRCYTDIRAKNTSAAAHEEHEMAEIDQAAVEQFVAGAQGQPSNQIVTVRNRMLTMIERRERARGPQGYVSIETMWAVADRLAEMI